MTASERLRTRAERAIPGGVNSPVRGFRSVGGDPVFIERGDGPYLHDCEGNRLIDYVMSWGALLLGHNHPAVRDALEEAVGRGTSFGLTSPAEIDLAELVIEMVPSVEMVRFVNSGTEATMSAIRLARAATGRDLIVKFDGCYHGHGDSFLIAAGSGVATLGIPGSAGVPEALAELTIVCRYNDLDDVNTAFEQHGTRIAAVIVEPFVGNSGFIPPAGGFHAGLRDLTRRHGALLIFDEVMTGFRVHPGGAQALLEIEPDLTTLGKVIGGGLPVGAYGGRQELMELIAPAGGVYQAGTLSGNPLAMAAGLAALRFARDNDIFSKVAERTRNLVEGLAAAAESVGLPFTTGYAGSMWGFFFSDRPVANYDDAKHADQELFTRFHRAARDRGVLLAPSPFEAGFVSAAHGDDTIVETVERLAEAMDAARA